MATNMRACLLFGIVLAVACGSSAERKDREAKVARAAVAAATTVAATAVAIPTTGRWDEPHVVERLVQSGLAPQALPAERGERYWGVPVLAYRLGRATLYAYVYADSVARQRVTDRIDPVTAAPKGAASPYPFPRAFITQNNLAAVLVGGSDRQQERVVLALRAGLSASR